MLLKSLKKGLLILVIGLAMPLNVNADSNALWDKLSVIAADNWSKVDLLTEQEFTQLKMRANSGDSNAQYAIGVMYMLQYEHEKAANWLKSAAEQGHIPARYSYNQNQVSYANMADLGW